MNIKQNQWYQYQQVCFFGCTYPLIHNNVSFNVTEKGKNFQMQWVTIIQDVAFKTVVVYVLTDDPGIKLSQKAIVSWEQDLFSSPYCLGLLPPEWTTTFLRKLKRKEYCGRCLRRDLPLSLWVEDLVCVWKF